ncbi:hypothetical protein [Aeromicrobium sp. UC242_57]|uniref:hypothetical protein n=1 Tax=Aeromicrobium sp. UC242_57 TaxID=3374624 RepID=UPI00379B6F43
MPDRAPLVAPADCQVDCDLRRRQCGLAGHLGLDLRPLRRAAGWFVVAVVLFTALTVLLRGIVIRTVDRFARGYTILGGLVLTMLGLVLTELVVPESGFYIDGWGTWIGVTLIVWAAGVAYGEVDTKPPVRR